jgi:hypothetical protein
MDNISFGNFDLIIHGSSLILLIIALLLAFMHFDKFKKISVDRWIYLCIVASIAISHLFISIKT